MHLFYKGRNMKNKKLKPKATYAVNHSAYDMKRIEKMSEDELRPLLLKEVSKMYPNEQFIKELLKSEQSTASLFEKDEEGNTILHKIAWHNHDEILPDILLKMKLSGKDGQSYIDMVNESGMTPLNIALEQESAEVARILIMMDANVKLDKIPPLINAIKNNMEDIAFLLIEKQCDAHATERYLKTTSLMWAIERSMSDIAIELIKRGVSVEERDHNGETPLTLACKHDLSKVIRALLEAGANPAKQNKTGWLPSQLCTKHVEKRFPELTSKKLKIRSIVEARYITLSIEMETAWKNILNKN